MGVNTTDSVGVVSLVPQPAEPGQGHVNTTANTYDVMESLDEDEVLHCVAASGWYATFEDGTALPLVCWAIKESDKGHGVIVEQTGQGPPQIDVSKDAGKEPGFVGYIYKGGLENG